MEFPGRAMLGSLALSVATLTGCASHDAGQEAALTHHPDTGVASVQQATTTGTTCTSASFDGHGYRFCDGGKNWTSARTYCQSLGLDLARIDSASENAFVLSKIRSDSWLGSNDLTTEGVWKWTAGNDTFWSGGATQPGYYTRWAFPEPNNLFNEDCGLLYMDGNWNDSLCSLQGSWVCETPSDLCPSDPAKTQPGACGCGTADVDTDGDGEANCVDQCPLDAATAIQGSCGCPSSPVAAGTSCTDSVCGGNSTCNGSGTCGNPSACAPDTNCSLVRNGASTYWVCENQRNYDAARQRCQASGMDLAVVDDAVEDAFVRARTGWEGRWLGAHRKTGSTWEWQATKKAFWSSGAPVNGAYTDWETGHPDNTFGDCTYFDGVSLKWQIELCSLTHAYVCERSVDQFKVDTTVVPLPATDVDDMSGQTRTIGKIVDEDGEEYQVVESEVLLETSNPATLNSFLTKYGGTVVDTMDFPADANDDLENIYQVRLDPTKLADASTLPANIMQLDPDRDPAVFRASSSTAIRTLATFAEASLAGYKVELNWASDSAGDSETLSVNNVLDGNISDAPIAGGTFFAPFSADNPMGWEHFSDSAVQHIGVGEAWQSLARAGKLQRVVNMAVFDSGFPSRETLASKGGDDYPDQTTWLKAGPLIDQYHGSAIEKDKWHGLSCAYAAWGKANNKIGGAGPAYPVVKEAFNGTWGGAVWTWKRQVYMLRWLYRNTNEKRLIVSISQGTKSLIGFLTLRFNVAVKRFERKGMLIFAGAGNDHEDVDKKRRLGLTEKRHHTPCELNGVMCIGGVDRNVMEREKRSNWGDEDVDLWAPWFVWTAATPDHEASWFEGTSAATPFAAGVAALVWAADQSLNSDDVKRILKDTATKVNNASHVKLVIDANAAVNAALSRLGPTLKIRTPANGSLLDYRFGVAGSLLEFDGAFPPPAIQWSRSGIAIGSGPNPTFDYNQFPLGASTVSARGTYSTGSVLTDAVTVTRKVPDSLRVASPAEGQCVVQGGTVILKSQPADFGVNWNFDGGASIGTGQGLTLILGNTPLGNHVVGGSLNDGMTLRTGSSNIRIVDPTSIPRVQITLSPVPNVVVPAMVQLNATVAWDADRNGTFECTPAVGCTPPFTVQFAVTDSTGKLIGTSSGAPIPISAPGKYFVEAFIAAQLPTSERCVIASEGQAFEGSLLPI